MTARDQLLDDAEDLPRVQCRAVKAMVSIHQRDLGEWSP